jgi:hypothetical protein
MRFLKIRNVVKTIYTADLSILNVNVICQRFGLLTMYSMNDSDLRMVLSVLKLSSNKNGSKRLRNAQKRQCKQSGKVND